MLIITATAVIVVDSIFTNSEIQLSKNRETKNKMVPHAALTTRAKKQPDPLSAIDEPSPTYHATSGRLCHEEGSRCAKPEKASIRDLVDNDTGLPALYPECSSKPVSGPLVPVSGCAGT
jgi:hypothetical protein